MPQDTALHKACNNGDFNAVKDLIAQAEAKIAAGEEPDEDDEDVIDVNAPGAGDRRPIHRAAGINNVEIINYLVEKGAVVDQTDKSKRTALHWAAISGHVQAAEALVGHGADILAKTSTGTTALHAACEGGRAEFVEFLIKTAGEGKVEEMCNIKDNEGKLPFDYAMEGKHKAVVQQLKSGGDPNAASAACTIS